MPSNYHLLAPSPLTISWLQGIPRAVSPTWADECVWNSRYGPALCNLLAIRAAHPRGLGSPGLTWRPGRRGTQGGFHTRRQGLGSLGKPHLPFPTERPKLDECPDFKTLAGLVDHSHFFLFSFLSSAHLSLAFFLLLSPSLSAFFLSSLLPSLHRLDSHTFVKPESNLESKAISHSLCCVFLLTLLHLIRSLLCSQIFPGCRPAIIQGRPT